jgi:hypothetical protein
MRAFSPENSDSGMAERLDLAWPGLGRSRSGRAPIAARSCGGRPYVGSLGAHRDSLAA